MPSQSAAESREPDKLQSGKKRKKKEKATSKKKKGPSNSSKVKVDLYPIHFSFEIKPCIDSIAIEIVCDIRGRMYSQNTGEFVLGEQVEVEADVFDVHDSNCMRVKDEKGQICGTIPAELAFHLAPLIHGGIASVEKSVVVSETAIQLYLRFNGNGKTEQWLNEFFKNIPADLTREKSIADSKNKEENE
jgi:hypothetical protein